MAESYGTIIAGIRKQNQPPPYTIKFGPFYAGTKEITAFATALKNLVNASVTVATATQDLITFLGTVSEVPNLPTIKPFDVNVIIDQIDFKFNITEAIDGHCGTTMNLPSTLLGALQNVGHALIKQLITQLLEFMDKINMMFTVSTRMMNNMISWLTDTKSTIKAPFLAERDKLNNQLKEYRRQLKITNNPIYVDLCRVQTNKVGNIDRKIRDLVTKLRALEEAIKLFIVYFEVCQKIGSALIRNVQNIIAAWQKDSICVQTKGKALIRTIIS